MNFNVDSTGDMNVGTVFGLTGTELNEGALPKIVISGDFTASANKTYIITGFSSTVTLPAGQPVGTRIKLIPNSAALTVVAPAANYFSAIGVSSTLGGTIVAQAQRSAVELEVTINAGQVQWNIVNFTGSWLISRSPTPYIIDQLGTQIETITKAGIKKDQSSPTVISALNSKLYDNSGVQSVDFLNRQLFDSSNLKSEDFNARKLYSSNGSTEMLDYSENSTAHVANPNKWRWGDNVNYVELNSFSNIGLLFSGNVRPRKILWIPIGAMTRTPGATLINNVNDTLNFTSGQSANFSFHVPWDCDQSVILKINVLYAPSTNAVGTVSWTLGYNINFPGATLLTAGNTAAVVIDNTPGVQDLVTRSSPLAVAANTFSRDTQLSCQILRGGGTFGGTCRVLGLEIEYTVLSMGN